MQVSVYGKGVKNDLIGGHNEGNEISELKSLDSSETDPNTHNTGRADTHLSWKQ